MFGYINNDCQDGAKYNIFADDGEEYLPYPSLTETLPAVHVEHISVHCENFHMIQGGDRRAGTRRVA